MALVVRKDPYSNVPLTVLNVSLPSPVLNLSLIRNLFSWAERLAINNYQVLSPDEVVPLSVLTFSLCQDPSFGRIIQNLNQLARETLEEDEPKITMLLQEARALIQTQFDFDRAIQAKVEILEELRKKALLISSLKEQAFIVYFNNGGREIRKKIDEAMVIAANKAPCSQDQATLDVYWERVTSNPWGAEWHQVLEKGVYDFFCKAMNDAYLTVSSMQQRQIKKLYGWFMKKTLRKSIKIVAKQWLLRRDQVKFEGDQIKLNYMILKGRLWWMPLIQHRLMQILEPILFKTDNAVQSLTGQKEAQIQKEIADHLEELNSPSCCIDPAIMTKEGCPESQLEYRLDVNKVQRERCLKELAELQAWTFEDSRKWARNEWGYNPEEIRGTLAEETPFDRRVIEVLSLTSVIEDSLEEDLKLDLATLPNPIAYFAERLQKRDEQALEELRLAITSSS